MKREVGKIFPPGHFYSPIPDINEIRKRESRIFRTRSDDEILGLDLNLEEQLENLNIVGSYANLFDYPENPKPEIKVFYYKNNGMFEKLDALAYFSFMIHNKPKKIIEVGAGFSSLLAMDVNKRFYNDKIKLILIEPYPSNNLKEGISFYENAELIKQPLQEIDVSIFKTLHRKDILFIDSTHVAKIGSDVNYIFFEVLPVMSKDVLIHFHDIFIPDEYPKDWVFQENRAWNEMYVLRAFLMYNQEFKTIFSSYYISTRFPEKVKQLCRGIIGGGSYWIKRYRNEK